jgi:hypothetical protein
VDLALDRAHGRLLVRAVHAEPGADGDAARSLATTLKELAGFLDARLIEYRRVPSEWRKPLGYRIETPSSSQGEENAYPQQPPLPRIKGRRKARSLAAGSGRI